MRTMRWLAVTALPFLAFTGACSRSMPASMDRAQETPPAAAASAPTATPAVADKEEEKAGVPATHADAPPAATTTVARAAAAPAPAKPSMARRDEGLDMLGAGGGRGMAMEPAPVAGFGVPQQFSGVKAGEWDDNANFREFQKFLGTQASAFHRVDLRDRRFLVVRDAKGSRCRTAA